ncbi:hypothetical protein JQN58_33265 [Aneurinibacillus sp. BA2021]|nr:hypothetical protein [Aneurinibacillus sp. BA2021]
MRSPSGEDAATSSSAAGFGLRSSADPGSANLDGEIMSCPRGGWWSRDAADRA